MIRLWKWSNRHTIADAFDLYLKTASPKKTEASQKIDKRVLEISLFFFKEKMGIERMSEVRLEHLEQFELWSAEKQIFNGSEKDEWSQATILRHTKTLKSIFRKAFLTGQINRDPAALWRVASPELNGKRRPMTDAEFERLLSFAPEWFSPVLKFMAATGARGSSIARLQWADVDFKIGVKLKSRKGGVKREKIHVFPMYDGLRELLGSIPTSPDFVFTKNGRPVSGPLISMTGYKLIRKAGLSGVTLYGLRHKMATDLLRQKYPDETIRRIMGHSNTNMIKNYTQHLGLDPLAEAVSSVRH